ncbi:UDP-N-acetylmuramoyl-L-alanyl-D-glutamate--2,6-diaminopimelate ligase [Deinococcus detaillensis]|uniref:UDP-N-acetylmuramyl-tripeptide synthetase n=1 Tax=Deinococcus detaillensis TaxID=2592048 RepID=A0A553V5Z6_9DEIO|nr:UDP-N-acetylmuramoyl-L-alanyl-D-glutamate--2,6-diaminopimelate ligase [Deinococcus detaillensis]TSA87888.1 UDP-N-acetylmuramoyl-L-alanyl-D-glutamate--2,6-diaminopimelate ligase [Deinococcus detaillensis]
MRLADLCAALQLAAPAANPEILGVTHNAAWVSPGDVFVAIRGAKVDGHQFAAQAAERGAAAIAGEGWPLAEACPLPYVQVPSARAALADFAAVLEGQPSRRLKVVGVTGTDGKTTTSWLTAHLLRSAGLDTGLLSTVGYQLSDGMLQHFPAHFTTPEAPQVQATLRQLADSGGQAVVLEASSHALALERVRAVEWDVAIWTHLSSEHLDFHGNLEQYFAEKRKLIERSPFAVLNADDPWTERLKLGQHVTYSAEGNEADWQAQHVEEQSGGLAFKVVSPAGTFDAFLPMIGRFNVSNALAGMAAAHHLGATAEQLAAGLASFAGVPGRMERVTRQTSVPSLLGPRVIVDFAHTPPSLEKALGTLRATTSGQLIVVIGSAGGPRDPSKRGPLGEVAARMADEVIFTEEDCRDTPLSDILSAMAEGAQAAGRSNYCLVPDRRQAISHAVRLAGPGDTVLLAGKGPEETLERLNETVPWNEVEEARAALELWG